jgi:flagellar motor protein MotB
MPTLKKPHEEEAGEGAPLWIISFADMTSLLMAFFVMLSTFASFDQKVAKELEGIGKRVINSGGWNYKSNYKALLAQQNSQNLNQEQQGSEKPTQDKESDGKIMKNTFGKDFRNNRIFISESSRIFWSKGPALTSEGRFFLRTLAAFTAKVPSRIVISEYGSDDSELGFQRAFSAIECLVDAGVSPELCNISAQTTTLKQDSPHARMFEVTLLDRNIYK